MPTKATDIKSRNACLRRVVEEGKKGRFMDAAHYLLEAQEWHNRAHEED